MPFFHTTSGIDLHYEILGQGQPLLLIHGWAASAEVWHFQQGLSSTHRLIMPDLRGHGLSAAPDSGYSFVDFADDLVELVTVLRLENVILIGWSMGVQVALQAYSRLRNCLSALVFVSGTPTFTAGDDYPHGLPAVATKGLELLLKRDFHKALYNFFRSMFIEGELEGDDKGSVVADELMVRLPARHAALEALRTLADSDLRSLLSSVDLPVLLIHGSADTICPASASCYMAAGLSAASLELLEGAGHAPFLSQPQKFNELLKRFMDSVT